MHAAPSAGDDGSSPARVAAILAGGAGARMGGGKATVRVDGRPLAAYAIDAAREGGLEPLLVVKDAAAVAGLDCPLLIEPEGPTHPIAGIVAALEHLGAPLVVLPCDAPLLPPGLIAALASRATHFAMPAHPRPQPLIARYTPPLLPRLRTALAGGEAMVSVVADLAGETLGRDEVEAFGDPGWAFANANDPTELERIAAELRRRRLG